MRGMRIGLGIGLGTLLVAGIAWTQEGEEKKGAGEEQSAEEKDAKEGERETERQKDIRKLLRAMGVAAGVREEIIVAFQLQLGEKPDSFWEDLITDEDLEEYEDLLIPLYEKRFTEEEIREWLAFYETPLGRKITEVTLPITKDRLPVAQLWGMKMGQRIVARMRERSLEALKQARMTSNEVAAVGALRTISSVQAQFLEGDREGDGVRDYATSLAELSQAGLIDAELGSGRKGGYVFSLSGTTYDWNCRATPESEEMGVRNFIVCTDGVVRFSTKEPADCSSEPLK